jgi:RsiW-degrading membrane proteinase PrsW (M82 family)
MLLIMIIGMLPAFILLRITYRMDKIEKEPRGLLVKLFIFGGLTTFAAMILESIGMAVIGFFLQDETSLTYLLLEYFLVVGISEEIVKYFVLKKTTWYHPAFNFRFDAIVYSVAVTLGFAAFENVMYIFNFGLGVVPIRAVLAIPMHCICGIFMGHYYGQAKLLESRHDWSGMNQNLRLALIVPVLLHGFYDFAASVDSALLSVIFLFYVIVVDVTAIISIKRYAREDTEV